VEVLADVSLQNMVIRLQGTNRYTTPYADGTFDFANLREGKYKVAIDERTVPEGFLLSSPAAVEADASADTPAPRIVFVLKPKPQEEKPIREMQQPPIHIGGGVVKTPLSMNKP